MDIDEPPAARTDRDAVARYRRDGYLVVRRVLSRDHVAACLDALAALATDPALEPGRHGAGAFFFHEPAADLSGVAASDRADLIRKFGDFIDTSPALLRAAMSARLHGVLDQLMGPGPMLLQEMALVKPPRIGSEKRWHQDADISAAATPN